MISILDAHPYPWGRADARRLRKGLVERFFEVAEARNLAAAAGLNPYALNTNQSPEAFWDDVLNAAAEDGLTRELAQQAHARLPGSAPLRTLLARLLAEAPPTDPGTRLRRTRATARLRFSGLLEHNRVVGGRTRELGALDTFLAGDARRHLVITGPAGMGKTALLAEWVRRLDARRDVDVVYYFLSRPHGTATSFHDLLVSLLTQAAAFSHGEPPRATDGDRELEERWLSLLQPGSDALRRRPMVVVVDGADEAEAAGWALPRLFLPAVLATDVHMVVSARTMAGRDWPYELGLVDADVLTVGGLDRPDVADLLAVAGVPDWVREPDALTTLMQRTGGDPFYLRFLVDALTGRGRKKITSPAGLNAAPDGLGAYLKMIWSDAGGSAGNSARMATLGYLSVTRGPITAEELTEIDPTDGLTVALIGEVLTDIGRVVVVDPTSGGMALAHWRLQEIVIEGPVPLLSRRERAARRAALLAWCDRWSEHRYPYAVTYVAAHRIESGYLTEAAELLVDDEYQKLRVEELGDAAGVFGDLDRLLRTLTGHASPDVATVVKAALAVGDARAQWSRPEKVFELAAEGEADAASRRLALLGSPPWQPWQQGAELVLAWVLAGPNEDAARKLLESATRQLGGHPLHHLLAGRTRHALDDAPEPELRMWFPPCTLPPSHREEAVAALEQASGQPLTSYTASGLHDLRSYTPNNESGAYLAEDEAPRLVAYARDRPDEGEKWLSTYIALQAANPYALYRNRALWSVLAAVCCLPDAEQALRYAVRVTRAAFAPSAVRFTEFARLATLAGSGDTGTLFQERDTALQNAAAVAGLREFGDQWGHHVRRLAAHAEVAAVVLGDRYAARALLDAATDVPLGYAGYRAPAYLALADTYGVIGDPARRHAALDQALQSAHNIQEPAFCALMTARVGTITAWWDDPQPGVPELVAEFAANPDTARFAPRHRIGDPFRHRERDDHLPIDDITNARDAPSLAAALDIAAARLLDLAPAAGPATIVLPDPEFAPMVAAHLSARIAASELDRTDRIRLTAALVPIAVADSTALDLVLGRWVCALGPGFEGLAALVRPLAGRSTVEPAGGGQAGVA